MNQSEIRQRVATLTSRIRRDVANAGTKTDEEYGEMIIAGMELLGELLIDIKRMADSIDWRGPQ
jgi:hypothetical protein